MKQRWQQSQIQCTLTSEGSPLSSPVFDLTLLTVKGFFKNHTSNSGYKLFISAFLFTCWKKCRTTTKLFELLPNSEVQAIYFFNIQLISFSLRLYDLFSGLSFFCFLSFLSHPVLGQASFQTYYFFFENIMVDGKSGKKSVWSVALIFCFKWKGIAIVERNRWQHESMQKAAFFFHSLGDCNKEEI